MQKKATNTLICHVYEDDGMTYLLPSLFLKNWGDEEGIIHYKIGQDIAWVDVEKVGWDDLLNDKFCITLPT